MNNNEENFYLMKNLTINKFKEPNDKERIGSDSKREHLQDKVFKRKKHLRYWRSDEIEGPLYADPFLMDGIKRKHFLLLTNYCVK